jgi:hypothetical protein
MSDVESTQSVARWRRLLESRAVVYSLYAAVAFSATLHRGVAGSTHTTFRIFRQSFWHLLKGTNLYAYYPAEQGGAAVDLFKYSPTAAVLFAPFAIPPYLPAMLLWSLLNSLALCFSIELLLGSRRGRLAQWLLLPEAYATTQAMQSNAIITALIIAGFVAMERRRQGPAAMSIVTAAALKIYPAAALVFAFFHPRRLRFAALSLLAAATAFLLPLLVTTPAMLVQQYRWWFSVESADSHDLEFGRSVMKLTRELLHVTWPNWPMQVLATGVLLLPLALRHDRWSEPAFRVSMLASMLAYAVLFNHQAEHASFVIAVTGVVIWYVASERGPLRTAVMSLCVLGLQTVPVLIAWLAMQHDLCRTASPEPGVGSRFRPARSARGMNRPTARRTRGFGHRGSDPSTGLPRTDGT